MHKYLTRYIIMIFFALIVVITGGTMVGNAEQSTNPTGFLYEVKFPENQKADAGYFDLKMNPSQQQTVQIILKNTSDKEITVEVSLNSTKTNSKGVLEYGPIDIKKDPSLKYDFVDIVKAPETVTLEPNSEKPLDIAITMPEVAFDGLIVGGIQLKQIDNDEDQANKGSNVINKYAYVIAMVLQESDVEVQPELQFNKVYASQVNYQNTIITDFSNIEANFLDNLSVEVQIMSEKSDEVLYETKKNSLRMAPNSNIAFPVSMQGEKMVSGKYRANILAVSGNKKWTWTEEFEITKEEADKFNRDDLGLIQNKGIQWPLIIGIAVGIFVLILAVFFVIRTVRKSNRQKTKMKKK